MTAAHHSVFFLSIPKCGKNILYSFLKTLGYTRRVLPSEPLANSLYSEAFPEPASYQFRHAPFSETARAAARDEFLRGLDNAPAGTVSHQHFLPSRLVAKDLTGRGFRPVFVKRDPRDTLLSMVNYARSQHKPTHVADIIAEMPMEDALCWLLEGGGGAMTPFDRYYSAFLAWSSQPDVLTVDFDDIIGENGGGDTLRQTDTFRAIGEHIGWQGPSERFDEAVAAAFNPGAGTFFRGQIGGWRETFTPRVHELFARRAGYLLEKELVV